MYFYNLKTSKWEQKPTGNINLPSAFAYHALGTSSNGAGGSTTGGSNNSTKPATTSSSSGLSMPIITGIAAGVLLIIALVVGLFFVKRQRAKKAKEDEEHRKRAEALSETGVIVMDKYGYQQDDGAIALPSSAVTLPPPRYESNSTSSGDAGGAGGYRPAKATAPVGEPLFTAVFTTPYVKANPFGSPNSEGTLDRLAKPVKLSSLNFNPQQTVMDRFRIKGAPISSDAARFIVFDAEDLQSRQLVAVKMFSDRPETPGQASLAFRREVAMLRKLQSKSVVELKSFHILDVEEDQRPPYTVYITVMQRCSENLSQFIERNANLPDLLIRSIIRSLTEALAFLATEGVVHADIKPANVLLVDSVFVRLADFETARIANRETITAASFAYSAPEVIAAYIRNQEVLAQDPDAPAVALLATHAVDMWGLGCVVYEMYAKRPLTAGMTDAQTIAFLTDPRDTPIVDRIPAGVIENVQARHLLQSLLARNPGARKSARVVLGSAYLNAGMDTQQLATSFAGIQEQVRRVDSTVTAISQDTRALVGQQNEMRRMLIGLITEPNVPRMMALIPLGPPSWTQVDQWGSNLFRLHFLCEAKGNVHFTIDPGYPLSDPRKFVRNLGPYLRAGFQIASLVGGAGLSAIMGGGRGGGGAAGSPASNPFQTLGIRPTEYFTRMTQLIDDVTDQSKVQASGGRERPFAARIDARMARELEEFMKIVDPGRRCGGLQRCVDRDGSIVWLCEEHANGLRH
ncbi:kinase-like domain-containing protein [Zopfochytrium polystomum]|nr:kinase-like domain-containing protein [Zopfochytrium polystomum]